MPGSYTILSAARLVYSRAWDVLTDEELLAHAKALGSDPRFEASFSQLADFRDVTELAVTAEGVRAVAARNPFGKGARRAIVTPLVVAYGMARMYELLSHDSQHEVRVVKNLAEAKAWLGEGILANWTELEQLKPDRVFGVSGT